MQPPEALAPRLKSVMASLASDYPVALFSIVAVGGWLLWKVFQNYLVRSPLDNVPGPARTSFWKGASLPVALHHIR